MSIPVLLICKNMGEKDNLKALLEKDGLYTVTCSSVLADGIEKLVNQPVRVAIFDHDILDEPQVSALERIRTFSEVPIVILAKQIGVYAYRRISKMDEMITLQRPFQAAILTALLQRLTANIDPEKKELPRFYTDEPVRMVVLGSGLLIPTRMKNYSAGGAFLEYRGISLKVGDKLQIGLDRPHHQSSNGDGLQMKAKVIWIKEGDTPRSPSRGIGVQFFQE